MSHDAIWAPWRLDYILGQDESAAEAGDETPSSDGGCFLCRYRDDPGRDAENHVVLRTEHSLAVLNRFPYNNGHLLIAPREHLADLEDLPDDVLIDTMQTVRRMTGVLRDVLTPDGFNVGLNLGHVAGAGLPGHLHWHVVPRWSGDTNFMPVLAETKVIPQSLAALHAALRDAIAE